MWAKVEGHDWWPARVVRRRAVPREVGPPPGGPVNVRVFLPVVFFTPRGIPGEVVEAMDSEDAAMLACIRVLSAKRTRLYVHPCCSHTRRHERGRGRGGQRRSRVRVAGRRRPQAL